MYRETKFNDSRTTQWLGVLEFCTFGTPRANIIINNKYKIISLILILILRIQKYLLINFSLFVFISIQYNTNEFFHFFNPPPKEPHIGVLFYLARHVVATHLEHLQLVPNLLKIFGTPSSVFAQLISVKPRTLVYS